MFKFSLTPVEKKSFGRVVELPHNRLIPTPVKVEVWRRDVVNACFAVTKNGAGGTGDIEGKAARVAASELGEERVSIFTLITTFLFRKVAAA